MTVTDEGKIYPGAMFVMEKLAQGANPETADWRYIMVLARWVFVWRHSGRSGRGRGLLP